MVKVRKNKPKEKKQEKKKAKLSQFLNKKAEGRQNRYVFKGFYEKLSAISAKLGHSNSQKYNHLQEEEATRYLMGFGSYENEDEERVQLTSNFIALMHRGTKINASLEYKRLHNSLVDYTSSYNLVVLKKEEIIDKLMGAMVIKDGKVQDIKLVIAAIDLLIALIKDLRNEISFETLFLEKIFPKIISMINVLELQLLEQIVHFFSYCFKFMMATILKNFDQFYKVYFEVLRHKNKFIKKFAAESFSYVLRKAKPEHLPKMINTVCQKPLEKPYKYIDIPKIRKDALSKDVDMEVENDKSSKSNINNHERLLYSRSSELEDPSFCQFEKTINQNIEAKTFTRTVDGVDYQYLFEYENKLTFIATLSTIFTETTYGVQKKLYTEWETFINLLIDNIKSEGEFVDWNVNILRYTVVNLYNRLHTDSIHDLSKHLIKKLGEDALTDTNEADRNLKLNTCLMLLKDLFVFKEGKKLSPINAVTNIGFLYKVLKGQAKAEKKLPSQTLFLLIECLYLGYHNKTDQYINIFDLNHSTKLVDLIRKLGLEYSLHFYCLASMNDLNQKFYDFSKYYIMLLNKNAKTLPVYYLTSEQQKMSIIFKPLAKVIFTLEPEQEKYMVPFLSMFIIIKTKIQEENLLEVPKKFISKLDKQISALEANIKEDGEDISGETLNKLWLYSKLLSMSVCHKTYDNILSSIEAQIATYKNTQKVNITSKHDVDKDQVEDVLCFVPNMNNKYKLALIVKANFLKLKFRNHLTVGEDNIFNYSIDPTEQYFTAILQTIKAYPGRDTLIDEYPAYFEQLLKMLITTRSAIRTKILEIFKIVLANQIKEADYNYSPLELMYNIANAEVSLDTEKMKVNDLEKLQNLFRVCDMPLMLQRIYLRFLIGMFWVKFTPIFPTIQKSLGELLTKYHDSLIKEFESLLGLFDKWLAIGPNDRILGKVLYHNLYDKSFYKLRSYNQTEIREGGEAIENRFTNTIHVFENVLKGFGYAIADNPIDTQKRLTERFQNFVDNEFLVYHKEFSKIKGIDVSKCKNDSELVSNMVDANSVETKNFSHLHRKNSTVKLSAYLSIIQEVEKIKDFLVVLLSINDAKIQQLALKLVFKLNMPEVKPYEKSLLAFNSDTGFKDEIAKFSLEGDLVKEKHRPILLPLVIRILNAKLLKKRGKASAKPLEAKRTIVYRFLASLSTEELNVFATQVIEPFNITLEDTKDMKILESKLSHCSFGQYLGYLSALESIVKQMGTLIQEYLPAFCSVLTAIFRLTKLFNSTYKGLDDMENQENSEEDIEPEAEGEGEENDNEPKHQNRLKRHALRSCTTTIATVFKRLNEIYEKYFFSKYIQTEFSSDIIKVLKHNIENFSTQNITAKSSLLEIFVTWSRHVDLHFLFLQSDAIPELCRVIGTQRDIVNQEVYVEIFKVFKNIIIATTSTEDIDKRDYIIRMFMDNKEEAEEDMTDKNNTDAIKVLTQNLTYMISSVSDFLSYHWDIIKNGVLGKKENTSNQLDKVDRKFSKKILTKSQVFRSPSFIKSIVFILSELSLHVNLDQKDDLEKLTDMFVPLLTIKGFMINAKEELVNNTLKTVERLSQKMPSLITKTRYYQISRLLSENLKLSTRQHVCDLLCVIPKSSVRTSIFQLKDMNKVKKGLATVQLDFDKAITSCTKFADEILPKATFEESIAVLFQMFYFLSHPEIALRSSAIYVLEKFIERYYDDIIDYAKCEMKPDDRDIIERSNFISYHLLNAIKSDINTLADELRLKACLKIFKKYLTTIRDLYDNEETKKACKELSVPNDFIQLNCLIDERDENVDFFENILNIKLQKRYRAIRQLCTKVEEKEISDLKTLTKIVLPIADMFIIRMTQAQSSQRGVISYTTQNFEQINNECFILYRKVCECLPWNLYQNILRKHIVKITGLNLRKGQRLTSSNEKNITKIICAMISGFSYEVPDVVDELDKVLKEKKQESSLQNVLDSIFKTSGGEKQEQENDDDLAKIDDEEDNEEKIAEEEQKIQDQIESYLEKDKEVEAHPASEAIQKTINKTFLPALFKHLKEEPKKEETTDDSKVRIHVAVAIVRLLRKTTNKQFNDGFHKLTRNVVTSLRSKLCKIRDRARDALTQIHLNVSAYLIHYTIDELQKSLRKGYQRHVRSFTLHHLLESLVKEGHLKIGQIDHCLDSNHGKTKTVALEQSKSSQAITSLLMDELFGKLGKEKDAEGVRMVKIKETKSKRALQSYEILSQYIDFEASFIKLIAPILNKIEKASSSDVLKKCEEVLAVVSSNVLKNPSLKAESLLIILYAIMKKGTAEEEKLKEEDQDIQEEEYNKPSRLKQEMKTMKILPKWQKDLTNLRKTSTETSRNMFVSFALSTLKKSIGLLPIEEYKEKLDSFVKLYVNLVKSSDNRVAINTLHVLGKSIKLSLPSIKYYCRKIINNLFILFTTSSDSEFMNALFKCTTELVKYMKSDLTDYQTGKLVEIIKTNLEHYQMQANVYGCLKAMIDKRVLSSHIYDIVDIISEKMITHINKSVRMICSQIFTTFLLEYPLEDKRIEQHVHHLIKNLTYIGKDGRLTVLEVIEKLVPQFPTEVLDKYAFILFLSLILRTVNEDDVTCKQKANTTLKLLLENVSVSKRDDIIKTVLTWDYNTTPEVEGGVEDALSQTNRSAMMKRVTFLLIGLIISIEGERFASKYFEKTFKICEKEINEQAVALKQLYTVDVNDQERAKEEDNQIESVKEEMGGFLKEISLLDDKDTAGTYKRQKVKEEVSQEECLTLSATLNIIEKFIKDPSCWKLLYKNYLSTEAGTEFVKNLLELCDHYFVYNQMCRLLKTLFDKLDEGDYDYNKDSNITYIIDDCSLRLARMFEYIEPNSDLGEQLSNVLIFITLNIINRKTEDTESKLQRMFDKCSFIGRKIMIKLNQNQHKLLAILKFFTYVLSAIEDADVVKQITKQVLLLVYRTYTNPKLNKSEAKNLSVEIIELLQKKLGNDFLTIYSEVKQTIETYKQERKQRERVSAAKNVEAFKKRRDRKHKRKKEIEREKNLIYKLSKYS